MRKIRLLLLSALRIGTYETKSFEAKQEKLEEELRETKHGTNFEKLI